MSAQTLYTISLDDKLEEMKLFKKTDSKPDDARLKLLIVYARDSWHHEQVLHRLVDLLRAQHGQLDVSVDFLCQHEMALNKVGN